jgi:hypothetical protein
MAMLSLLVGVHGLRHVRHAGQGTRLGKLGRAWKPQPHPIGTSISCPLHVVTACGFAHKVIGQGTRLGKLGRAWKPQPHPNGTSISCPLHVVTACGFPHKVIGLCVAMAMLSLLVDVHGLRHVRHAGQGTRLGNLGRAGSCSRIPLALASAVHRM